MSGTATDRPIDSYVAGCLSIYGLVCQLEERDPPSCIVNKADKKRISHMFSRPVHFRSYVFFRIHCVLRGVQTRSELVVAAIRDALGTEAQIDFLRHLQGQKMISSEIFTEYHRLFEVAINAHYFTAEVEYSGLILHAALATLKKIDRTLYNAIQGNRHTHCRCCWCCGSVQLVFLWLLLLL